MSGFNFTEGEWKTPPASAAPGGKSPVLLGLNKTKVTNKISILPAAEVFAYVR